MDSSDCLDAFQHRFEEKWLVSKMSDDDFPEYADFQDSEPSNPDVRTSNVRYTPYGRIVQAHSMAVTSVKVSPDGKYIATSSADRLIKLWDGKTFEFYCELDGHQLGISDLCWSPDSRYIASASDDTTVRIWSVDSFRQLRVLRGHTYHVLCVEFNFRGNILISGSADESIRIWDVYKGQCLKTLSAHSDPISSIDICWDGTLIASGSFDGLIRLFDTDTGQCLKTLICYSQTIPSIGSVPVSSLKFSPNGKYILASTLDNSVKLWDYMQNKVIKTYEGLNMIRSLNEGSDYQVRDSALTRRAREKISLAKKLEITHITKKKEKENQLFLKTKEKFKYLKDDAILGKISQWNKLPAQTEFNDSTATRRSSGDEKSLKKLKMTSRQQILQIKKETQEDSTTDKLDENRKDAQDSDVRVKSEGNDDLEEEDFESSEDGEYDYRRSPRAQKDPKSQLGKYSCGTKFLLRNSQPVIISGSEIGSIYMWNVQTKELLAVLEGFDGPLFDIDTNEDETLLFGCGNDGDVRIWRKTDTDNSQ